MSKRWYKVTVGQTAPDGGRIRSAVGIYRNAPNAVFGVMRKLQIDREDPELVSIRCELLPKKPPRFSEAAYTRHLRQLHESL